MYIRNNPEIIARLFRSYTSYGDEELKVVQAMAMSLPHLMRIDNVDVFIDIPVQCESDVAVVVAEGYRDDTIYKNSFFGECIFRNNEPAVFRALEMNEVVRDVVGISYDRVTGQKYLSKQTTVPICYNDKVIAVLIIEKSLENSNERIRAKKLSVEEQKKVIDLLVKAVGFKRGHIGPKSKDQAILIFNESEELVNYNNEAQKIYKEFGYDDMSQMVFDNVNLTSIKFKDINDPGNNKTIEENVSVGTSLFNVRFIKSDIDELNVIMLIEDISELDKFESEIKNHLVSYQEINHRIKNNLQTIASLLRLQIYKYNDESIKHVLEDSIGRVLSIAVTHDLLSHMSGDDVNIIEVIKKIVQNVEEYSSNKETDIKYSVQGKDFYLDSKRATMIGLVINELLQNSIKHAFVGRSEGEVLVKVINTGDILTFEVSDNGVGYDTANVKQNSLGLMIVKSYVEETLKGKLIVRSGKEGTTTMFAF